MKVLLLSYHKKLMAKNVLSFTGLNVCQNLLYHESETIVPPEKNKKKNLLKLWNTFIIIFIVQIFEYKLTMPL